MRPIGLLTLVLLVLVVMLAMALMALAGACSRNGGAPAKLEDRTSAPLLDAADIEVVAELDHPPGNVAVSASGRVFFTFHASGKPGAIKVAELVNGKPVPYPDEHFQNQVWNTPLSLRIDRQGRLWVLDDGGHGFRRAQLLAFELDGNRVVLEHVFDRKTARVGSMLNDFQIDGLGATIYIADTSFIARKPALLVYDVETQRARRVLERHASVSNGPHHVHFGGQRITVLGLPLWFGVDSIALDRKGEWLYYAAVNSGVLYRIATRDLETESSGPIELADRVERFADITLSDGLSTDNDGNIYITDMEHSAIVRLGPDKELETIARDPALLRWPDGLSFGPEGWLYVTASALPLYLGKGGVRRHVKRNRPYHILRMKPGARAIPGH